MKIKRLIQICFLGIALVFPACNNKPKNVKAIKKSEDFPSEMVRFSPSEANPVFKGTGTDTWDQKIRERGFILFDDGIYKMWYTGYNNSMAKEKYLGYATSPDGVNWARYSDKPVFSGKWTEDVFVIKNNGLYYMYAEGENDIAHLLVSKDGISWKEKGDLVIRSTKGDTIPGPYGTPSVWIENDKWYLFYERNDSAVWIATTNDKITWTNIQDEPVLIPGPEDYDRSAIAANQVVKFRDKYYIYYHATSGDYHHANSPVLWSSNVAVSSDLIHWFKYPGNPIVECDHSSPILVFDGKKPSLYTMHSEVCRYLPE
ncbi:MAG TPA: hypothetical protein PLR88_02430 [Bacteroidales bacterium]|nr:hypothetical protein [Bacteroidales bacterium]HPT20776.1 hypothetical protein [Bacteroidales bacterium]